MKNLAFSTVILSTLVLFSCGSKRRVPDVSGIHIQLDTLRFERDFFSADTQHTEQSLDALQQKYPKFVTDYLYNLLGSPPVKDSVLARVKQFIHDYKPVYDSVMVKFPSVKQAAAEVSHALQFVKYYFPNYKAPQALVTFTGPLEGYSNVITGSGFAVGLQQYLGKDYPAYNTDYIADVYPQYQSRRFEPDYIAVDCIKNVVTDIYPPGNNNQALVYQMIEAGKRMYALDAFMPDTPDSLKTGYTQQQVDWCNKYEAAIWNQLLQNNLLYVTDIAQTRDYMNDGPRTEEFGPASPGFIGQFVGWQIVKKWMADDSKRTLPQLLQTPASQIFEQAKYKPR